MEGADDAPRPVSGPAGGARAAGVVLAAGASRRMPGPSKLLRAWGETTVVGAVVDAALAAGLAPVVVVAGHDPDPVCRAVAREGVTVARHDGWRRGRASSLAAGLSALASRPGIGAAVVLLGDEPGVPVAAIDRVVAAWREGRGPLLRARYRERPGHPVLLDLRAWDAALRLDGDGSAWERLTASGMEGEEVPVDAPGPIDVDRPADLAAARARRAAGLGGRP